MATNITVVISTDDPAVANAAINAASDTDVTTSATPKKRGGLGMFLLRGIIATGVVVGSTVVARQAIEQYQAKKRAELSREQQDTINDVFDA